MDSHDQNREAYHGIPFFISNIKDAIYDFSKKGTVYTVIDLAGSDKITYKKVCEYNDLEIFPLYVGTDFEPLLKISPWLIALHPDHGLLEWLIEEGPTHHSGIFIISNEPIKKMIAHLQGLLEIKLDNYNTAAFRFYDPRVLNRFAIASDHNLLLQFLGNIDFCAWGLSLDDKNTREWYGVWQSTDILQNTPSLPLFFSEDTLKNFEKVHDYEVAEQLEALFGKG